MRSRIVRSPRVLLSTALLLLLAWGLARAQSPGKISGTVTESGTGEPLPGCNVVISGTRLGGASGPDGSFFVLNVPPGKYDVVASIVGYQRIVQRGVIVNADRTTAVNFALTAAALAQQEIVVEAGRPDVEREKTSTSAIIRTDDVQAIAGMRDVGDVLGLAADITDGHFRGGREGEELYLLQGMGITNPLNSSSAFMPIMSAVEEVEVITSGFGAQYGNAQSGVVNISMKEGKSDAWHSRFETRMRGPGRKHFGPSIFDPQANPYLAFFLDPANWLRSNPQSTNSAYYASMGGLGSLFGQDTAVQLQVAQALWRLQSRRDINRNYGGDVDYSLEGSTGGPIDDNLRMFVALRSYNSWPVFPTEQPDVQRQVMGNLVADLGNSAALRLSGGYAESNLHVFPSSNSLGFYNWLWDRILSIDYDKTTNTQMGLRFTQTLSPSTFYELKLNTLLTRHRRGSTPSPSSVADSLIVNPQNSRIDWDKVIGAQNGAPDFFNYLRGDDEFRDEKTATYSFEGSLTSQVTKSHLLNAGVQANVFDINVLNHLSVRQGDGGPVDTYTGTPYEAAAYLQDKMEFQGMIANVGLRLDLWNSNMRYYPDQMIPYRVFNNAYPGDTTWTYNRDGVQKVRAPLVARLQPRIGVSFPVSVNTVFHLNYGSFLQRPPLQYELMQQVKPVTYEPISLGNPRLEPQTTNSYDLGVMQGLGEGFTLDVSGYYKDVRNLIEQATFVSSRGSYTSYFNRDYADIRGFRVALGKRRGASPARSTISSVWRRARARRSPTRPPSSWRARPSRTPSPPSSRTCPSAISCWISTGPTT